MRFATHFFEHGAMPIALASLPVNTDPSVVTETQNFLQNAMSGLANAFRVQALSGEIDIKKFTPELNTLAMGDIREHALEEIAWAFKIPKTILSAESNNFATAEEEKKTFVTGTINSLCEYFEEHLNPVLAELDEPCKIEYAIGEMHEMQVDEWRRSQAFKNYVDGGLPIIAAAQQVGLEIDDSLLQGLDKAPKLTDSEDVNVKAELARWMTKAIKKIREGKHLNGDFKTEIIPVSLQNKIREHLKNVKSENDIRLLFQQVEME